MIEPLRVLHGITTSLERCSKCQFWRCLDSQRVLQCCYAVCARSDDLPPHALAKLVCLKTEANRVVGFHFVGPNAGEVTQGFGLAMRLGATKQGAASSCVPTAMLLLHARALRLMKFEYCVLVRHAMIALPYVPAVSSSLMSRASRCVFDYWFCASEPR